MNSVLLIFFVLVSKLKIIIHLKCNHELIEKMCCNGFLSRFLWKNEVFMPLAWEDPDSGPMLIDAYCNKPIQVVFSYNNDNSSPISISTDESDF